MITIAVSRRRVVRCEAILELPMSSSVVWGQIRDFQRYASQDFFHANIRIEQGLPRAGARLTMEHRFGPFMVQRIGRILFWREGVGYAFSDLSLAGSRDGFPHIFVYKLESVGRIACRLHLGVSGRWTSRCVPRWAARLWLAWVFRFIVRSVDNQLLAYQLWCKRMANQNIQIARK